MFVSSQLYFWGLGASVAGLGDCVGASFAKIGTVINVKNVNNKINRFEANKENHYQGIGFLDFWFYSNSKMMDKFSTLYNHRKKYNISAHKAAREHVDTFTDKIRYVFYRWHDHEMVRRYFYESAE